MTAIPQPDDLRRPLSIRVVHPASQDESAGEVITLEIRVSRRATDRETSDAQTASPPPDESLLLRVEEAAELLSISRTLLYPMLGREIPVVRIGRSVRVPRGALTEYIAKAVDWG